MTEDLHIYEDYQAA